MIDPVRYLAHASAVEGCIGKPPFLCFEHRLDPYSCVMTTPYPQGFVEMLSAALPRAPNAPLILATDLDGTFAGGSPSDRARLQQLLAARSGGLLIYVTGRSVPATRRLIAEVGLPHPDILIADVGTTIRQGPDLLPVPPIEAEIAAIWPGGKVVRERLAGLPAIVEQEVRSPYRVSYSPTAAAHLAAAALPPVELRALAEAGTIPPPADADAFTEILDAARARLADLPVDLVGSAGIYLDVLPRGVNKGTTLRRALTWLDRPESEVLVAGDSLNDLALFETGLNGVVVGNAEPELVARVEGRSHIYLAKGHGAAGILDGLVHFGWIEENETPPTDPAA